MNHNIKTTGRTLDSIKDMAPKLTEKQQQVVFGVLFGMVLRNEEECRDGKSEKSTT